MWQKHLYTCSNHIMKTNAFKSRRDKRQRKKPQKHSLFYVHFFLVLSRRFKTTTFNFTLRFWWYLLSCLHILLLLLDIFSTLGMENSIAWNFNCELRTKRDRNDSLFKHFTEWCDVVWHRFECECYALNHCILFTFVASCPAHCLSITQNRLRVRKQFNVFRR